MKNDHIARDGAHLVITATDFKATCLDIFSRLAERRFTRVTVTRRGKPVAELFPPETSKDSAEQLIGFMRGSVRFRGDIDLTDPVIDIADWSPELPA